LTYFKTRKKVTLKELWSLIGLLNFACTVVKTGISFLRRFIDLAIGLKSTCHRRWLTKQGRADVHAWSLFIESLIYFGDI
jgi:hypothetical protein